MDENENAKRFGQMMVGLMFVIFGLVGMGGGQFSIMPIFVFMIGASMLWKQFQRWQETTAPPEDEYSFPDAEPASAAQHSGADQVYRHALDAVTRAGRDPADTQVLPVDIGIMAFRAGIDPAVCRSQPVLDDVDYIQPFVQLRLPTNATGRIRFEIVDSDGQTLFIHEDNHQLQRGRNLVTPSARLPIHDAQVMHGDWELRVSADGVLLASHPFRWREQQDAVIRRHVQEDGEISNELRAAISDSTPGSLSLDELLSAQEQSEQQQRRG